MNVLVVRSSEGQEQYTRSRADLVPKAIMQEKERSEQCMPCPRGAYQNEQGISECIECPPRWMSLQGCTECLPCAPGTRNILHASSSCEICPAGSYQNETAAVDCHYCSPGSMSLGGAIECRLCAPNQQGAILLVWGHPCVFLVSLVHRVDARNEPL